MTQITIPQNVRESMCAILQYNWADEARDYEENDKPEGHVFEHLLRVDAWLDETARV